MPSDTEQMTNYPSEYVATLEAAVLDAEWWLADPNVAARKDMRGDRKRSVYKAADLIRTVRSSHKT